MGVLPSVNINYELPKGWSLNAKAESRFDLYSGGSSQPSSYLLSDGSLLASKETGPDSKFSFGYLHRFNGSGGAHRSIQQYSLISALGENRIAHRIGMDQTFFSSSPTVFRLRYRIGFEFSLNGADINKGESYLKITAEFLNRYTHPHYSVELRFSPAFGLLLNQRNKVEIGLDNRISSPFGVDTSHTLWTTLRWYYKISQ